MQDTSATPPRSRLWKYARRFLIGLAVLVTLVAALWIEENIRGKHAWLKYKAELEARGEKLDFTDFIPPKVPDDQNFAMTPLLAPLLEFRKDRKEGESIFADTNAQNRAMIIPASQASTPAGHFWTRSEASDLNEWATALFGITNPPSTSQAQAATGILDGFKPYQAQMDEIQAASRRPHSRFNVLYETKNPPNILLPHLAVIKREAILFQVRASAEIKLGQPDAAAADIKTAMYISGAVASEPFVISHLVRIAIAQIALEPLWVGLAEHKWSDAQLADYEQYLAQIDLLTACSSTIRGELAMTIVTMDSMRNNTLRAGDVLSSDEVGVALGLLPSGWFYQNTVNIARLYEDYALPPLDPGAHRILMDKATLFGQADRELTRGFRPYRMFAMLLFPSMSGFTMKSAVAQVRLDEAIIACGLERYRLKNGQFPETLEALKPAFLDKLPNDVITGQPLIYRRKDDGGFLLYSIGWNNKDDGGKTVATSKNNVRQDLTAGDWVWPEYPAK